MQGEIEVEAPQEDEEGEEEHSTSPRNVGHNIYILAHQVSQITMKIQSASAGAIKGLLLVCLCLWLKQTQICPFNLTLTILVLRSVTASLLETKLFIIP